MRARVTGAQSPLECRTLVIAPSEGKNQRHRQVCRLYCRGGQEYAEVR